MVFDESQPAISESGDVIGFPVAIKGVAARCAPPVKHAEKDVPFALGENATPSHGSNAFALSQAGANLRTLGLQCRNASKSYRAINRIGLTQPVVAAVAPRPDHNRVRNIEFG